MAKCKYYDSFIEQQLRYTKYGDTYHEAVLCGRCTGTKETERCYCRGDESRCDFYPDIKQRAVEAKKAFLERELKQLKPEDVKRFVLAGKAFVTLKSGKTGKQFTYKIVKSNKDPNVYSIRLREFEKFAYRYIGSYYRDTNKLKFAKQYHLIPIEVCPPYVRAIKFLFERIDNIPEQLMVFHNGRCGRCGRPLTNEESMKTGFGAECYRKERKTNETD